MCADEEYVVFDDDRTKNDDAKRRKLTEAGEVEDMVSSASDQTICSLPPFSCRHLVHESKLESAARHEIWQGKAERHMTFEFIVALKEQHHVSQSGYRRV